MNLNPASSSRPPGIRTDAHAFKSRVETGRTDLEGREDTANNRSDPTETQREQFRSEELTPRELKEVRRLKKRDLEVKTHERSHASAGGQYVTGGINLRYRSGPDGQRYAVAGEVRIDTSAVPGNPEATERKMQAIKRAALAPANPSAQDRKVAANAAQLQTAARAEIITMRLDEGVSGTGESDSSPKGRYAGGEPEREKGSIIDIAV